MRLSGTHHTPQPFVLTAKSRLIDVQLLGFSTIAAITDATLATVRVDEEQTPNFISHAHTSLPIILPRTQPSWTPRVREAQLNVG
ncbi:unnamed protein product [Peniophora sp. CBMAI 1063]|nr:unnamed protein product [Peniophora sp. CBMAI 1063]